MIPAAGDWEKNKNTKKIVIPIAASVVAVVAVLVVVLVISNFSSQNIPYDSSSSSSYGYSSSISTQYLSDRTTTCDGLFESGALNSNGELTIKFNGGDRSNETDKDNYVDGCLNGEGTYTIIYQNGDTCEFDGTF